MGSQLFEDTFLKEVPVSLPNLLWLLKDECGLWVFWWRDRTVLGMRNVSLGGGWALQIRKVARWFKKETTLLCKGDMSGCSLQGKPKVFPNIYS